MQFLAGTKLKFVGWTNEWMSKYITIVHIPKATTTYGIVQVEWIELPEFLPRISHLLKAKFVL